MPSEILLRNYLGKMGAPKKKKFLKKVWEKRIGGSGKRIRE
jgi:hypothetical protein